VVQVADEQGRPVAGQQVDFALVAGHANLSAFTATTDAAGRAAVRLTLGNLAGGVQVQAKVSGHDEATATFSATARPKAEVTVDLGEAVVSAAAVPVGGQESPFTYQAMTGDRIVFTVRGEAPPVQVGDILVNTTEPYFLKKVVEVARQSSGELVVETRQAALTEVVKQASIRQQLSIPDSARQKLALPRRTKEFFVTFDNTTIAADAKGSVKVTAGHLSFDPQYDFALEIEDGEVEEFLLAAGGQLDASLAFQLAASGALSLSQEKELARFPLKPYHFVVWAGYVPIVIGVQTEFSVGAEVSMAGAGTLVSGGSLQQEVRLGAERASFRPAPAPVLERSSRTAPPPAGRW
jgi:hypothetical protein